VFLALWKSICGRLVSYLDPVDAANMRFGLKPPFSAETAHSKLEAFDPKP
jgi:hypothetical protein